CRAELERLEQRSARFSGLVGEIDLPAEFAFPEPPRTTGRVAEPSTLATGWGRERRLRAAAVLLVVLVPLLTVTPLRATVADWLAEHWSQVMAMARPDAAVIPETSETPAEEPNSVLWFAPNGSELRIEVATWQQ